VTQRNLYPPIRSDVMADNSDNNCFHNERYDEQAVVALVCVVIDPPCMRVGQCVDVSYSAHTVNENDNSNAATTATTRSVHCL